MRGWQRRRQLLSAAGRCERGVTHWGVAVDRLRRVALAVVFAPLRRRRQLVVGCPHQVDLVAAVHAQVEVPLRHNRISCGEAGAAREARCADGMCVCQRRQRCKEVLRVRCAGDTSDGAEDEGARVSVEAFSASLSLSPEKRARRPRPLTVVQCSKAELVRQPVGQAHEGGAAEALLRGGGLRRNRLQPDVAKDALVRQRARGERKQQQQGGDAEHTVGHGARVVPRAIARRREKGKGDDEEKGETEKKALMHACT